jgi:endoglucanase
MLARAAVALVGVCAAALAPSLADATPPKSGSVPAETWSAYKAKFVQQNGRVVDDANRNISHSESQGYGMLLAFMAGDRAGFEQIWSFTKIELLLRDDGLAAWRWEPEANPHVTDINNASDGDILIAYALALAGTSWRVQGYLAAGRTIAKAVGAVAVERQGGRTLLLPAATGFRQGERPDGPVVNLSYWVFEALPILARLAPETNWAEVGATGLALIDALSAEGKVVPDWLSLAGKLAPAQGFDAEFSYNAVRVPLYLMRAGLADKRRLEPVRRAWRDGPGIVAFDSGRVKEPLPEPGYRMIQAAMSCTLDGTKIPEDLRRFEPTLYYPSTLHILGLALIGDRHPQCL